MKKYNVLNYLLLFSIVGLFATGCSNWNKTQKGVAIGAGAGGAVGAGVGKAAGNTALGAIIGAAVGGVTGGIIGKQMDKQAEEIAKIPGADVKRVEEGINVTFESGILFAIDQSNLTGVAQTKIKDLANVFTKYPDSYILIEGHTDASGSADHNMALSEQRAKSVAGYLESQGVAVNRIKTAWYGETQPKFPNDTKDHMAQNRRVEFAIYANESLIEKARRDSATKN